MSRTLALIALVVLVAGCTRYGTNPVGGPFARKPKPSSDPYAVIPPGPPATSSPLALAAPPPPVAPSGPDQFAVVPPRTGDPVALTSGTRDPAGYPGDVIPAGG